MFKEVMSSSLKAKSAVYFLAVILISGCPNAAQPKVSGTMRENVHPNGLSIKLNESFAARQTVNGFVIEPAGDANKNLRVPIEIIIDFNQGKDVPADSKFKEKTVESRKISYKVEKNEGGSGGETYDFTGFEKVSGGVIEYRQTTQSEGSEPDFSSLWEIVGNTALKK